MKSSYTTTPRTMSECTFIPGYDPIERHYRDPRPLVVARIAVWALAMVFGTALLIGVFHA